MLVVPVYTSTIDIESLCDDLRLHGLVVIETTRTHAKTVHLEAQRSLGIDPESADEPVLLHLSFQVDNQGWSDVLLYSEVQNFVPGTTQDLVRSAVRSWLAAGEPSVHYARLDSPPRRL